MSGPPRLLDRADSGLGSRLLRSAERDVAPRAALTRALQAASVAAASTTATTLASAAAAGDTAANLAASAGAGTFTGTGTATATATAGTTAAAGAAATAGTAAGAGALKAVLVWLSIGAAGGGLVTGLAREVATPSAGSASSAVTTAAGVRSARTIARPIAPAPALSPTPNPASIAAQPDPNDDASARLAGDDSAPRRALNAAPIAGVQSARSRSLGSDVKREAATARLDFADELVLVDRARTALAAGNASAALASAAAYQARFRLGHFQSEMLALQIEALAAGGQRGRARELARSFLASYPKHPLADRVRQASGEP